MTRRAALVRLTAGVLLVAGLGWWVSAERMQGMDVGPTASLGGLGWFTATWMVMMAAMMLPVIWPAIGGEYAVSSVRALGWRQLLAPIATILVYLGVWTLAGALAYVALRAGRSLAEGAFAWDRAGHWLCVGTVAIAAAYQISAVKTRWLARCHGPVVAVSSPVADGMRAGLRAGLRCVASSWALMAVLFALGAMSLVWMAVLAGLIALERLAPMQLWTRSGALVSIRATSAAVLLALGVTLAVSPGSVPGFTVPDSPGARQAMVRMNGMRMTGPVSLHMTVTTMRGSGASRQRPRPAMPMNP